MTALECAASLVQSTDSRFSVDSPLAMLTFSTAAVEGEAEAEVVEEAFGISELL